MSDVLAVLRKHSDAVPVTTAAGAVARPLGATTQILDLTGPKGRTGFADQVLAELDATNVIVGVIMGDGRRDAVTWRIACRATKPIVIVPRSDRAPRGDIGRVLVPLDGKSESSAAVMGMVAAFVVAGVDVLVLHVFEPESVPHFWDHAEHAQDVWGAEFRARHHIKAGVRLQWRSGSPPELLLDVADKDDVDLIALGWSRTDRPGRARITRQTVRDAHVPVLLIPILD